jgi:hypothetical protein
VVVWLVNPRDSAEVAYRFVDEARSGLPVLLDADSRFYNAYPRPASFAPFPFQVLIDRDGVIRGIYGQYDAVALQDQIDALLAE